MDEEQLKTRFVKNEICRMIHRAAMRSLIKLPEYEAEANVYTVARHDLRFLFENEISILRGNPGTECVRRGHTTQHCNKTKSPLEFPAIVRCAREQESTHTDGVNFRVNGGVATERTGATVEANTNQSIVGRRLLSVESGLDKVPMPGSSTTSCRSETVTAHDEVTLKVLKTYPLHVYPGSHTRDAALAGTLLGTLSGAAVGATAMLAHKGGLLEMCLGLVAGGVGGAAMGAVMGAGVGALKHYRRRFVMTMAKVFEHNHVECKEEGECAYCTLSYPYQYPRELYETVPLSPTARENGVSNTASEVENNNISSKKLFEMPSKVPFQQPLKEISKGLPFAN